MGGRDTRPHLKQSPRLGQELSAGTDRLPAVTPVATPAPQGKVLSVWGWHSPMWHLFPVKPARQEQV